MSTPLSQYHSPMPLDDDPDDDDLRNVSFPSSASSSRSSLAAADEGDATIVPRPSPAQNGKRDSIVPSTSGGTNDDIQILALSTRLTEISCSIDEIGGNIYEIQELRHRVAAGGDAQTGVIDQALSRLDEKLESISQGIATVNDAVAPLSAPDAAATADEARAQEVAELLRKHGALVHQWEAAQDETDVLREELKEDKWLVVFRTVLEQADGMMTSLEKAVTRCQDFIWQVHKLQKEETRSISTHTSISEYSKVNLEQCNSLISSFEAKKRHYVPATSKVLQIMENGVQNRVTKNGETLRKHSECMSRWNALKDKLTRVDQKMESVRRYLAHEDDPSENSSGTASHGNGRHLATPASVPGKMSRASSRASTLSRSMSPLRKFAKRFTGGKSGTPSTPASSASMSRESSMDPSPPEGSRMLRRQKTSLFSRSPANGGGGLAPTTPEKGHKSSHSLTPETSPNGRRTSDRGIEMNSTVKQRTLKQPWNSSTKVEHPDIERERIATIRATPSKRPSARSVLTPENVALVPSTPSRMGHRSVSRCSNASSRPWSPITSTSTSSHPSVPPPPSLSSLSSLYTRPPSSRSQTPYGQASSNAAPRPRPNAPSHIPAPSSHGRAVSSTHPRSPTGTDAFDDLESRAFSPTGSVYGGGGSGIPRRSHTPSGTRVPPPRPPSRSMIPLPSVQVSAASRPGSAMSQYQGQGHSPYQSQYQYRPETPSAVRGLAGLRSGAQTPETTLRARAERASMFGAVSPSPSPRPSPRPSLAAGPPSSFRSASNSTSTSASGSRPPSRSGALTPSSFGQQLPPGSGGEPLHVYVPGNARDPLDAEVAAVVNGIGHGLLVERVSEPMDARTAAALARAGSSGAGVGSGAGEEIRAQYAFSNALARKVVTCRLTTMVRAGREPSRRVMVRVGGGWQDLGVYVVSRQAGV
ncbi:hypothetical protein CONPUDRAFT_107775 [Coniophora puteana RWD-64-598 SS2]|uniref:GAR domain-containing protein n=1 Tax=Coniophora puteana (strain RWD-64-598) TaxID=741705 RepID=A0A5M3MLE7_CONPW|nr:uncharacterized protein CONPUDRAFT_107775 [Coniophora puteana RWD-64-598 SS2]EIW79401.1 hypothetical protein CONPUDRAFT_107775 [Coniophora puteana RWD-64-598 SS2]